MLGERCQRQSLDGRIAKCSDWAMRPRTRFLSNAFGKNRSRNQDTSLVGMGNQAWTTVAPGQQVAGLLRHAHVELTAFSLRPNHPRENSCAQEKFSEAMETTTENTVETTARGTSTARQAAEPRTVPSSKDHANCDRPDTWVTVRTGHISSCAICKLLRGSGPESLQPYPARS